LPRYSTTLRPKKQKKKFPPWWAVAGFGLIILAALAFLANGRGQADIEVSGAPRIKISQDSFDYGDVKLGLAPVRTVVRVTNVGDQTLVFREAPYLEVLEGC